MENSTPMEWAQVQFGQARLNDPRRTQRLISIAASLANQPGVAVSKLAISSADIEGAYRFIRNDQIQPNDIAEAGFQATAENAKHHSLLLALEDTTSLTHQHKSVRNTLGHTN